MNTKLRFILLCCLYFIPTESYCYGPKIICRKQRKSSVSTGARETILSGQLLGIHTVGFFFCFIYQQYCFIFPSHRNCTDLCCCFRHPCSVLEQSVSLCPDLHIGKLQTWIMVWYIANKLLQTGSDILLLSLHYLFYKSVHTRCSGGRIVLPLTPGTAPQRDVCK